MGKIFKSLPFKLLLGVVVGILLGLVANEAVMNVVVTVKQVLGQIITFCVPLIVIGFIAPSITKLGHNASRMLMVALVLAYCSSVGAALASASAGYAITPHLSIVSQVDGLKELPEVLFQLEIPPLMNVMSALALSLMVGLAITWTKSKRLEALLDEIQNVVLAIVSKIIIPLLPFFIASTFCGLAYEGTITKRSRYSSMSSSSSWSATTCGCCCCTRLRARTRARTPSRSSSTTARHTSPRSARCPLRRRLPSRCAARRSRASCARTWSTSASRCSRISICAARF